MFIKVARGEVGGIREPYQMRLWEGTSSLMSRRYLGAASHARGRKLEMVQPRPTTASQMTAYEMTTRIAIVSNKVP